MKSALKLILVTLPILLIGMAVLVFVVSNKPPPAQKPLAERATAVRIISAQTAAVAPQVTGFGLVSPARTFQVIPQVQGIADYVNPELQKGAILPGGELLLRISPTDFNLEIAQARANIRAAQARLAELSVSGQNLASALAIEKEALLLAEKDFKRIENLSKSGTVSPATLDSVRSGFLAQKQKVLNVESSIALLPTQRDVQLEQIAVYETSLESAKIKLERTEIRLPFTARVASSTLEVGQYVHAFIKAAEFDGVDAAEVDAQVSVDDLLGTLFVGSDASANGTGTGVEPASMGAALKGLGLSARVRLQIGQDSVEWPASVERISSTIDQQAGTVGVFVRINSAYSGALPGRRPPLTKGMFVEVDISAPAVEGIVIPRSALRNGQIMYVDGDNRLQVADVTPKFVQGEIALVSQGIEPGMKIIVSTPSPIIPGMLLDITEDTKLMQDLAQSGAKK